MENDNPVYEEVDVVNITYELQLKKNDCYESVEKSSDNVSTKSKNLVPESKINKKAAVIVTLIFAIVVLLLGAAIVTITVCTFNEISKIKSEVVSTNQRVLQQSSTFSTMLESAQMNVSLEVMKYQQLVRDLEDRIQQLHRLINSTADMVTALDARMIQEAQQTSYAISTLEQQSAQNDSTLDTRLTHLASFSSTAHQQLNYSISAAVNSVLSQISNSCAALSSSSPAGYYYILSSTGSAVRQYCPSITTRCGQTGRWRSVANLDMTNSTHLCFSGLRQHIYSSKRLCVRSSDRSGCSSVQLPTTTAYRSVCGLVRAYQFGSIDAFRASYGRSIDSPYVDGVSITHGSRRQHIWSFAATRNEEFGRTGCPCMGGSNDRPSFVGDDYFCDTGALDDTRYVFYGDDPLWDGAGCGPTNNCCHLNNTPPWSPPWFYKELSQYAYDSIELRLCCDQGRHDEDIALEAATIYVK